MVTVRVRETYDLHTQTGKLTVIGVHTPSADIIQRNYPGLLMQCKAYRPVSCDVRMACASVLPLDPLGVGTSEGAVAPEDIFNPILYKAVGNFGMSQIETYLHQNISTNWVSKGSSLDADTDGLTTDDYGLYYGLLANTHEWKHANPQAGMSMSNLRPLVYERLETIGQIGVQSDGEPASYLIAPNPDGSLANYGGFPSFRGNARAMPWLNCTAFKPNSAVNSIEHCPSGFVTDNFNNWQVGTPAPKIYCGIIIVPPSRLHQMFYRLVCEWTLEFTTVRPLGDIASWSGLANIGNAQHIQDYSYTSSKTLVDTTDLVDTSEDSGITKVM